MIHRDDAPDVTAESHVWARMTVLLLVPRERDRDKAPSFFARVEAAEDLNVIGSGLDGVPRPCPVCGYVGVEIPRQYTWGRKHWGGKAFVCLNDDYCPGEQVPEQPFNVDVIEGRMLSGWSRTEVTLNGEPVELRPSLAVVNHSPTGFSWGYGGSGPAQLALALLLAKTANPWLAERHHQEFKREFIERLSFKGEPLKSFRFEVDLDSWVTGREHPFVVVHEGVVTVEEEQ
jgi:hypothetical protein